MGLGREIPPQVDEEDLPRWWGLSFRKAKKGGFPSLVFLVREECAEPARQFLAKNLLFERYAETLGALFYETDMTKGFGFDRAMVCEKKEDGYLHLVMTIDPRLRPPFYAANYSILLFALCSGFEEVQVRRDNQRTQLMGLEAYYLEEREGYHGAPMGGKVSASLVHWVAKHHQQRKLREEVVAAMYAVYKVYVPKKSLSKYGAGAFGFAAQFTEKGRFFLQCPGNACDISTDVTPTWHKRGGYELGCHNLDNALQQIELLAGLAALHDLATKDLDKK